MQNFAIAAVISNALMRPIKHPKQRFMDSVKTNNTNERLLRFLQATPEQQVAIDRILSGETLFSPRAPEGPLLCGMSAAARYLGVSRATLWRMTKAGVLQKVEVLPGSYRVRRADLLAIAAGRNKNQHSDGHD